MFNIKEKLDEYLEFDSDLLFNIIPDEYTAVKCKRLVRIFGGSLRDIIANQKINDIDILVGSKSIRALENVLYNNGYINMESLAKKDILGLYGINVISEPKTWIKNYKIVQLIRPRDPLGNNYEESFINLIQNVDISSCGLSYDGNKLYENYKDAILHCRHKVFYVNKNAKMYSPNRIYERIYKLESRGWCRILSENDIRDLRIKDILKPINYEEDYELSYKTEYLTNKVDFSFIF